MSAQDGRALVFPIGALAWVLREVSDGLFWVYLRADDWLTQWMGTP